MSVLPDQDVVRLQVAVYNVSPVEFFYCEDNLSNEDSRLEFWDLLVFYQILSEVFESAVVHHQVEFARGLECVVHFHYKRMIEIHQNALFQEQELYESISDHLSL